MAFLFSPKARSFSDESLESYLLRVVAENFFDSYQQLSLAIREELHELDFEAHGAFPVELKRLNVYHAKHNSHFRMRALGLLESLLDLPPHELQKLALLRSNKRFVGGMSAVHRNGVDIPLSFIRCADEDGIESLPICPQCLKEEPYIRQAWHIKPIEVCAKHECELIHHCPDCQQPISYIENESITHCSCGFEFATASSEKADSQAVVLSRSLFDGDALSNNPLLFMGTSVTHRFAALLWYLKRHVQNIECKLDESVNYFEAWPENFYQELDELLAGAELKLIDLFNRTSLSFIFGELILQSQCLLPEDKTPHFIDMGLMEYLGKLVESHPKSKKPNVADMLVSVTETAVLLSTSHEQVYRLYQDGVLTAGFKQKIRTRIDPHIGVFYLRQVIEYKTSFGNDKQGMYLSAW
ncbi:TniQ family protein [Shewanella sp. UCD-KL21]|uniref:TniQ family protein n=1 Tax=Shewanella sp. UCD-KL21 TaxID=1917164 RepID=UPI00097105F2|nr:TniQ family protein [Shewanella sp. UCD-KL21]USN27052.1 TniQ family protein [synthetic construct]